MTERGRWPDYSEAEIAAAADCLRRGDVNGLVGQEVSRFEAEFAAWCGAAHALAVANGTVALDLALWGLDLPKGSEVIVTPRSYVASASVVVNAGLVPIFADVDPETGNLSAETIAPCITERTSAILVVHLNGWPCDMDPILALARTHGLRVIEDCAQAHGARYRGRSVGTLGDVAAWSFCQDKIMTTGGEGGMVTTDDAELAERMWSIRDHGKSRAAMRGAHPPGFRWVVESFGTNWRLTGPQAAIGRVQLGLMPDWSARRATASEVLRQALLPYPCITVPSDRCAGCLGACDRGAEGCRHAHYRLQVWVNEEHLAPGWSRDRIIEALDPVFGDDARHGPCPTIYDEKAFREAGLAPEEPLATAVALGERSIMFKIYPTMTRAQLDAYAAALHDTIAEASL